MRGGLNQATSGCPIRPLSRHRVHEISEAVMPFFIHDNTGFDATAGNPSVTAATPLHRTEICPPALFSRSRPYWQRLLRAWWRKLTNQAEPSLQQRPKGQIQSVREAFFVGLADLSPEYTYELRCRIEKARSLRELWHLRADVFNVLAQHRGQSFAHARLSSINTNFPSRVPQSGHCTRDSGRTVAW